MSVLLAHPGAGPFVEQTVRGLHEAGLLDQFLTAVALEPNAWHTRCLLRLPLGVGRALSRRVLHDIPAASVKTRAWGEIKRALANRLRQDPRHADRAWDQNLRDFSAWAGRELRASTKMVYGYDYGALELFEAAAKRGLYRVLEQPAAAHEFNEQLLEQEAKDFPALSTPYREHARAKRQERSARRDQELALATGVVCNSRFTRGTFAGAGVDVTRFHVVPLAAPPIQTQRIRLERDVNAPLQVVFAGNFSAIKGAHYLLQALKQRRWGEHLSVSCFGAQALPETMLSNLAPQLMFRGSLPHAALLEALHEADVLLLPGLSDGFGMVVTEALAAALPVIVTTQVGAADLLTDREQGLLIAPRSAAAIAEALQWCLDNRQALAQMRPRALACAQAWQWPDYRAAHAAAIRQMLAA